MYELLREFSIQYGEGIVAITLITFFLWFLFRKEGKPIDELKPNKGGWSQEKAKMDDLARARIRKMRQQLGEIPIESWEN